MHIMQSYITKRLLKPINSLFSKLSNEKSLRKYKVNRDGIQFSFEKPSTPIYQSNKIWLAVEVFVLKYGLVYWK